MTSRINITLSKAIYPEDIETLQYSTHFFIETTVAVCSFLNSVASE
jgi:hypothetical protein